MATHVKTVRTLVAAGTTCVPGTPQRGTLQLATALGGSVLTYKITNGATPPTAPCEARVLIAHNASLPAAGSLGADWKTVPITVNGGTTASTNAEWLWEIPAGVMNIEVEFTGNTNQNVTVEAFVSEVTSIG